MKKIILFLGLSVSYLICLSQETGILKDPRDGKEYKTIKIGTQWVMAENLKYKPTKGVYWGSDTIYICTSEMRGYMIPDSSSMKNYSYFYDFETANSIAIPGWHVPSKDEWKTLCKSVGGNHKGYSAMVEGGSSGFNVALNGYGIIVNDIYYEVINGQTDPNKRYNYKVRTMENKCEIFWCSNKFDKKKYAVSFNPPLTKLNSGLIGIGVFGIEGASVRLFKDN